MKYLAALMLVCSGCVDIPSDFSCDNIDCPQVAEQMCSDGYIFFCKETNAKVIECLYKAQHGFYELDDACKAFLNGGPVPQDI